MPIEYPYDTVEEIQELLKNKVPFPVDIATSISRLVDEMWEKVKDHDTILSSTVESTRCLKGDTSQTKDHPCKHAVDIGSNDDYNDNDDQLFKIS